jgi:type I restriction enzyme, S subunit
MNWQKRKLDDVAELILGKMLDQKKNKGDLLPYLANVNVRWGEFDFAGLRQMRFEKHELDRFGLKHGDIVMCEGGEPGRCAIWKDQVPGMMLQKALHRIRPKAGLDSRFLYYSFLSMGQCGQFAPLFTGSTIKHLPREKLGLVEVAIPPLHIQRKIAGILSAYDDLIENNTRRIAILEEMAQAIYREWFVHFRFPGHETAKFVDSPLGRIPEGWRVVSLKHISSKIGSGATPRGGKEAYKADGISLIRSLNVYDNQFERKDLAFIDDEQAADLDNVVVQKRDILLNITGASVARCCMVPSYILPARVNQHVAIVRVRTDLADPFFVLNTINSERHKRQILALAQGGATREALTKDTICNYEIVLPEIGVLRQYGTLTADLFDQRELLQQKIDCLRSTRDLLLPKLISGQLDVESLDIDIGNPLVLGLAG